MVFSAVRCFCDDGSSAVVAAVAACTVREGRFATVGAVDGGCRFGTRVELGPPFVPSGFGYFGFRMCHGSLLELYVSVNDSSVSV